MADTWKYSVGNILSRAPRPPVAVPPAFEDELYPLERLGDGYPDQESALHRVAAGEYEILIDGNLLAESSESADAPTGWRDLQNLLEEVPGLPQDPPDWGTYEGRTALRIFRPSVQEIDIMPGETARARFALFLPTASDSDLVQVIVVDLTTGLRWDADSASWTEDGVLAELAALDAWTDFDEEIDPDTTHTERRTYRVIVTSAAYPDFGPTTYAYISAHGAGGSPAFFVEVDTVAIVGHRLPSSSVVTLTPVTNLGGEAITLPMVQPQCYAVHASTQVYQSWLLSITIPAGLIDSAGRPKIGSLWVGKARALDRSPEMQIEINEGDPGQIRVEAARGRVEVLSDQGRPASSMRLKISAPDADYVRIRDEFMRLTGFGHEPLLLLPSDQLEGAGHFYHGRVGKEIGYSRLTAAYAPEAWRSFVVEFAESPLAAP